MYRATPITYFVNAMVSTGIAGAEVQCSAEEMVQFNPPTGQACGLYLHDYLLEAGGSLSNPNALRDCQVCPVSSTDSLLARFGILYHDRWRNLGVSLTYSIFNVVGALTLYWLLRVPKKVRRAE